MGRSMIPAAAMVLVLSVTVSAEDLEGPETATAIPEPQAFVTLHEGEFNGVRVSYSARAGETYLRDESGEPTASFFSFAYTATGSTDPASRPVIFVWNGGPGSASLWLHMGAFGPRRVAVPSDARNAGSPPYPIVDNTSTVLDIADLVFVDPVATGFSRPLGDHEGKEFWGLIRDAESVAGFIRRWLTDNGRWNSPKFLAGESFGTVRAAVVADILEGELGISLNGVILISQALDYAGSTPVDDNLMSFISYLPTMAATAAYHGKASPPDGDLEAFLTAARGFAVEELAPALLKGSALGDEERARIVGRLAFFTGLDPEFIERSDLRVTATRFRKELLRDRGLSVGRADARYTRDDLDDTADRPDGDAASDGYKSAFIAAVNDYITRELQVEVDRPYVAVAGLGAAWDWRPVPEDRPWEPAYVNVARRLSGALRRNPSLRVMVASGTYDFATPFFDAELTFRRHAFLEDRIDLTTYEAGHMMYVHQPSLERFMADVRRFIAASLH